MQDFLILRINLCDFGTSQIRSTDKGEGGVVRRIRSMLYTVTVNSEKIVLVWFLRVFLRLASDAKLKFTMSIAANLSV